MLKAEYVNLFKFMINADEGQMYIVFEEARPIMSRDQSDIGIVSQTGIALEEKSALIMSVVTAKQLADELNRALNKGDSNE